MKTPPEPSNSTTRQVGGRPHLTILVRSLLNGQLAVILSGVRAMREQIKPQIPLRVEICVQGTEPFCRNPKSSAFVLLSCSAEPLSRALTNV